MQNKKTLSVLVYKSDKIWTELVTKETNQRYLSTLAYGVKLLSLKIYHTLDKKISIRNHFIW